MSRVEFICDYNDRTGTLTHFWEHTVGSGHATLALRADWQAQLRKAHDELGFERVRFHGMLSDDMGTLIIHADKFLHSYFNIDRIFDFLLSIGMQPFVELSFMPRALASGNQTVFDYQANITPPRDLKLWGKFIERLTRHWVDRYGIDEVREWHLEVWNEPNLKAFWAGTQDDYFELYRHTAEAIKAVDADLKVGGPSSAKNEWIDAFLEFCGKNDLPADFITTHHYPTDAFGSPGDDTETQLAKGRRSVLREEAQDARRDAGDLPLYYTEWNASSNPRDLLHDQPYAAAFVTKTIMEANGIVDAYSFWTFSDIFEENYFPSVPFHGGFGLLNLHGVPKPTYRAYEILHRLGDTLLLVDGIHETVDAWAVRDGDEAMTILLTNHALPRHAIETERVRFVLCGAPAVRDARVERIDEKNANAKAEWEAMGEPEYPKSDEVERLMEASEIGRASRKWKTEDGVTEIEIDLPPHAVAAVTLEFETPR